MASERIRQLRPWAVVVGVAGPASLGFSALHLPSPVLFGALVGGMTYALLASGSLEVPPLGFQVGQALVGTTIGALFKLSTAERLGEDWPSILAVTIGTLVISVLAGQLLGLRRDVSATTGAFALIAGGASGITALARDLGADDRVVSIVQYLRVLVVLFTLPLATTLVFHRASQAGSGQVATHTSLAADLLFTAVAVTVGLVAAHYLHLPAGSLLGPLLVGVAISISGVLGTVTVPVALENLGYALIGIQVGLRFTRASLLSIARLLPVTVLLILLVIGACAGMGALLSAVTGVDELTAYLATTPGGLYAVLATAAGSGADVTYVLAVQVIRVFVMLLAAPLLSRLLSQNRSPEPDA